MFLSVFELGLSPRLWILQLMLETSSEYNHIIETTVATSLLQDHVQMDSWLFWKLEVNSEALCLLSFFRGPTL